MRNITSSAVPEAARRSVLLRRAVVACGLHGRVERRRGCRCADGRSVGRRQCSHWLRGRLVPRIGLGGGADLASSCRAARPERVEHVDQRALEIIGVTFIALAALVGFESICALVGQERPDVSHAGIALTIVSLIVMPLLARAKRRVGRQLGAASVEADSQQTMACAYLSVIVLVGLVSMPCSDGGGPTRSPRSVSSGSCCARAERRSAPTTSTTVADVTALRTAETSTSPADRSSDRDAVAGSPTGRRFEPSSEFSSAEVGARPTVGGRTGTIERANP